MDRTYSELMKLNSFEERFNYLKLNGKTCAETFGAERYLNQVFYKTAEWKSIRNIVITRDLGRDLGIEGHEIYGRAIVHHMNPVTIEDINSRNANLLNPEYLITVSHQTHNALHYGDENLLQKDPVERFPNDTCPWRR